MTKTTTQGALLRRLVILRLVVVLAWALFALSAFLRGDVILGSIGIALVVLGIALFLYFARPGFDADEEVALFPPTLRHPRSDRFGPAPRPTLRHSPDDRSAARGVIDEDD